MAKKKPVARFRCEECGWELSRDRFGNQPFCRDHPDATRIPWGRQEVRTAHYLLSQPEGTDLFDFVDEYVDDYYPGVSRGEMALALTRLRRWGFMDKLRAEQHGHNLLFGRGR